MNTRISIKPIRHVRSLATLFAIFMVSTFAQDVDGQVVSEPAAKITAIYKQYQGKGAPTLPSGAYSSRLQELMRTEKRLTPKGEVGRLDFDVFVNGQDWAIKNLNVAETERHGNRAVVRATFVNFDQPQEILFQLVQQSNRWQIDEITSLKKPRWTLSKILRGAADAFPKD